MACAARRTSWAHGVAFFLRVENRGSGWLCPETTETAYCNASVQRDRVVLDVIGPRICAEVCMCDGVAFSQYEQGGYLGSPILSSAVFSTRDHRGADLALPRHAVNSTVPLTRHG